MAKTVSTLAVDKAVAKPEPAIEPAGTADGRLSSGKAIRLQFVLGLAGWVLIAYGLAMIL